MRRLSLAALLLAALPATTQAQDMIGVTWFGSVYTLDSSTGTGTLLGSLGWSSVNSMAKDGSGNIYVMSGGSLIQVDTTTGAGTLVVNTTLTDVRGLAVDPTGVFYAIQDNGIGSSDDLYTLDPVTGTGTLVGSTGFGGIQGLAWHSGALYAWDCGLGSGTGDGLITLDTSTGAGTDVNPAVQGTCSEVQGLASNGNTLYGARDILYTVSTVSGSLTAVGSGGYSDLRGIEFTSAPTFTLSMSGQCPGPVVFSVSGSSGGSIAYVYGFPGGGFTWMGTPCFSTTVDISSPSFIMGGTSLPVTLPQAACGRIRVQAVDVGAGGTPCPVSNFIDL